MSIYFKSKQILEKKWRIRRGTWNIHRVYKNHNIVWDIEASRNSKLWLRGNSGASVSYTISFDTPSFQYKIGDDGDWITATSSPIITESTSDYVYLANECAIENPNYHIDADGNFNCQGDTGCLMNISGGLTTAICSLEGLFKDSKLMSASSIEIPFTTIKDGMYKDMFSGCTNLVSTVYFPDNIKLTSSCCESMFEGCTALTGYPSVINADSEGLADSCFKNMFKDCTNVFNTIDLSAFTTLAPHCYEGMYQGCTRISTKVTNLPAIELEEACYKNMFNGCTKYCTYESHMMSLPATTLAKECYYGMFKNTAITATAEFNANDVPEKAYYEMYAECPNLTTIQTFNATSLGDYACYHTFYNSTKADFKQDFYVTTLGEHCCEGMFAFTRANDISILPAVDLKPYCYAGMFERCSGIGVVTMPAVNLVEGCYNSMYKDSWIVKLDVGFTAWVDGCMDNWVENVTTTGYFWCQPTVEEIYDASHIPINWQLNDLFYFLSTDEDAVLTITNLKSDQTLEMSNDMTTWTAVPSGRSDITLTANQRCYLRGTVVMYESDYLGTTEGFFVITQSDDSVAHVGAYGSLSYVSQGSSTKLFMNCKNLVHAPVLDTLTVADKGYLNIFEGCTNLTDPPLVTSSQFGVNACYHMFDGCTSLIRGASLTIEKASANAFEEMYQGATALVYGGAFNFNESTSLLGSNALKNCYAGLTTLKYPPSLSYDSVSLILPSYTFYQAFKGCTALKEAATVHNTNPEGEYCLANMYEGAGDSMVVLSTSYPYAGTTSDIGSHAYYRMFYNADVPYPGTLPLGGTLENGSICEEMFAGSTVINAPAVKCAFPDTYTKYDVTKLAYRMFANCTSLKTPSTFSNYLNKYKGSYVLAYQYLNCTSLQSIESGEYSWIDQCQSPGSNLYCNYHKYENCSSITQAKFSIIADSSTSWIPGSSDYNNAGMFINCTSLKKAWVRVCWEDEQHHIYDKQTLHKHNADEMFKGCTSINYIWLNAGFWWGWIPPFEITEDGTYNWLLDASSTGTFDWEVPDEIVSRTLDERSVHTIPSTWTLNVIN